MADAQGINKRISINKETTWGTKASAAGAVYLRRVTGNFQLDKDTYKSDEIRISQQTGDMRHGTRKASGSLKGEVAGNSYSQLIAATLRRDFTVGSTTTAIITVAVAETAGVSTFTRSSLSFITNGFKVGDPVTTSGFVNSANNGLFIIVALTATVMTVEHFAETGALVTEVAGATVTLLVKGRKTLVPLAAHTDDSFTIEEWNSDVPSSRTFLGMRADTMGIDISPNSIAGIDFSFMGKNGDTPTTAEYFTTPTAQGSTSVYSSPDGLLLINGVASRKITSLNLSVANNLVQEGVLGSTLIGAKGRGKVDVTIKGSAIFTDNVILGYFDAETEIALTYALRSADGLNTFVLTMPRVKIGSATNDDGEKVVILSFDGAALEYVAGGTAIDATTLAIIDTTIP